MIVSLRHGPFDDGRRTYPVTVDELVRLARDHGLICREIVNSSDVQQRALVSWDAVVLELPDDGSGAFPLLRGIILNDAKSSTYKLALLRCLLRIANSAQGLAVADGAGQVRLPLGLVALYWIRTYLPLLGDGMAQRPDDGRRLGFETEAFSALTVSPYGLKVGARLRGAQARDLQIAMRECAGLIRTMPAAHITWPNTDSPIFAVARRSPRSTSDLVLDDPTLESFGELLVPEMLWNAMTRHGAWIEPALESEWIALMQRFDGEGRRPWDDYQSRLRWIDPAHDTSSMRRLVEALRASGRSVHCTWTSRALKQHYAVDHVMPFARWPCNDLWNLTPASVQANNSKGDRLPSIAAMGAAKGRLCDWWDGLRRHSEIVCRQFDDEVRSALPFVLNPADAAEVFDGLSTLRASLRRDQQIPEWAPAAVQK